MCVTILSGFLPKNSLFKGFSQIYCGNLLQSGRVPTQNAVLREDCYSRF